MLCVNPAVKLVDMKKEYSGVENTILSKSLIHAIDDRLKKSEQVILLQNRRGYSRVQRCLDCGEIIMCKQCSVALIFHQTDNNFHCHYCEAVIPVESSCQSCKSDNIIFSEQFFLNKFMLKL